VVVAPKAAVVQTNKAEKAPINGISVLTKLFPAKNAAKILIY
jgi:hypothetical protein